MIMVFVFSYYRNRVRHVDEHFDLDLTYITDRIIGKIFVNLHCIVFFTALSKSPEKEHFILTIVNY